MTFTMKTIAQKAREDLLAERTTLVAECDAIDLKAIRPLLAVQAGTGTDSDLARIKELEEAKAPKRARIEEINSILSN